MPLGSRGIDQMPRFQRISLVGRLDPDHQFLLDNRSYQGRPGFEVLTPLQRPNGRIVLIDRGWVPFSGLRERLPGVALKQRDVVTVVGRVDNLPSPGLASGRAAPDKQGSWPKVTAFPSMDQLSLALGVAAGIRDRTARSEGGGRVRARLAPAGNGADPTLVVCRAVVVVRGGVDVCCGWF